MTTATSPEELTLDVQGLRLAARVWGPSDGAPVLALHGWLDNAATFDRLAPLLDGCRVVALDLPGHGRSEHRGHPTYYFVDYVADAFAAAAALGWERFSLLGHSMGGGVAALLAGTIPERIVRLALVEGLAPLTDEPASTPARLRDALESEVRSSGSAPRIYPDLEAAAEVRHRATGLPIDAARIIVGRALAPVDGGLAWRTDPRLRRPSRLRLGAEQVQAFLRAIRAPVRLVLGDRGWPFDPEVQGSRVACVEDLEITTLAGGHHLHLEDPAAVAAILGPFLAGAAK